REVEVGDQRDDAAVRGADRVADQAVEVGAGVARGQGAVELAPARESARDATVAWLDERRAPERRHRQRDLADRARELAFALSPSRDVRCRPPAELGRDFQFFRLGGTRDDTRRRGGYADRRIPSWNVDMDGRHT